MSVDFVKIIYCATCSVVLVRCIVSVTDGSKIVYEYKKNLPYDIIEKDCTVEVSFFISIDSSIFSLLQHDVFIMCVKTKTAEQKPACNF